MTQFLHNLLPIPASTLPSVFLVIGVVLLLVGGHFLVQGAVTIARRLGMPILLIGLTIVAAGTSTPELVFNLYAAWSGNEEMCFGNVVGSNIANISLVLGICAVTTPLVVHSAVIKRELPLLLAVTAIMLLLAYTPSLIQTDPENAAGFSHIDGVVFLLLFICTLFWWYHQAKGGAADPMLLEAKETTEEETVESLSKAILLFLIGLIALFAGGEFAKDGAVGVAHQLGMSDALIGLTIVALATSLPEVAASLMAVRKGHTDLAVGNVVGSNLFNILLVLGATSVGKPIPLPEMWGWVDLWVMLILTMFLLPISMSNQQRITRTEGVLFLISYCVYMAFCVIREYKPDWIQF